MSANLPHSVTEVIFVGLPGPTHHYAGLSEDNVAAMTNRGSLSNPKQAALQALDLIRLLKSLGLEAAILPPQLRPHIPLLQQTFPGEDEAAIVRASVEAPHLLEKASSSSAMWTANAATVAPVTDSTDGKLHITVANLFTNIHRRIEADDTFRVLSAIFADVPDCIVHAPLSAAAGATDEGAANHMRLSPSHAAKGLQVFVYGAEGKPRDPESARQSLSASRAVAALHQLPEAQCFFLRQNPDVIRQGVFHNDVIAVSNEYVLLAHERAYAGEELDRQHLTDAYRRLTGKELTMVTVTDSELSVEEAVHTYFFNSQIVTRPDGGMTVIAPMETQTLYNGKAWRLFEQLRDDPHNPIDDVQVIDLRQSMRNGGGPACLRLRVPMAETQLAALRATTHVLADDILLASLARLIEKHYPEELSPEDLGDPKLYRACRAMLRELGEIMRLPLV